MIGYKNEAQKRIGISKLRLMAGSSARCAVCDKALRRPPDGSHKCIDHMDWEMIVVDGGDIEAAEARLQEKDSEA